MSFKNIPVTAAQALREDAWQPHGEAAPSAKPKVLFLSRNYPNPVTPLLGLWVEGLAQTIARHCEVRVVSPSPYCPPVPGLSDYYTRFRRIPRFETRNGVRVTHPRFLLPPGYWCHGLESFTYYWPARSAIARLRREFPFDLIHAEFGFPDGYVAARLGKRYGVPVVTTEHAPWRPWMDDYPLARFQAVWAARNSAFHIAVSRSVREEIAHFTGDSGRLRVIPNGVDTHVFRPAADGRAPDLKEVLFVGAVRRVKGLDVLLKAVRILLAEGRDVRLTVVGEPFFREYRRDYEDVHALARDLDLGRRVEFIGGRFGNDLAERMRNCGVLVLPSRKESLGMVLAEAIACGTPVVATRCGGPEDIVTEEVGVLTPPEDPAALARGIASVLDRRSQYDARLLHNYIDKKFSWEAVASQTLSLYSEAIAPRPARPSRGFNRQVPS